ncbi:MAG: hypothetical protein IT459_07390 [Planctomycetes bacterium]|nr:hypothetical protein [Planctomycetota bacterium]
MSERGRRWARRGAALALGCVLAIASLELGLRIASPLLSGLRGGGTGARTTILCVGDSHTFGLHVLPSFSYPAQLQQRLDPTATSIGVVNYGVPGRNSGALLAQIPDYLEQVRPAVVLVLVGFNDSWNFEAAAGDDDAPPWWTSLRVVRLLRLIRLNLEGETDRAAAPRVFERDDKVRVEEGGVERVVATSTPGLEPLRGEALRARVGRNVEHIVARVRDHGAIPVLLTYATEHGELFVELNANARESAHRLDVALVEVAEPMRAAIAAEGYANLFFTQDDHPTARGYEHVARIVAEELARRRLVAPLTAPGVDAPPAKPVFLELGAEAAANSIALRVRGGANTDFQIVLSPRSDPPLELPGFRVPLGADPLLFSSLELLNLRGRTDASGTADVSIERTRIGDAANHRLFAVVATFEPGRAPMVSERLVIDP